jgi:chemosensory pili system protein ChpC
MNIEQTIRTQLIPLHEHKLLLPNTAVAEVVPYEEHNPMDDLPEWLMGSINWRGKTVPLTCFDTLLGSPRPEVSRDTRVIVLNTLTGNQTIPFFAILSQGIPHLLRVAEDQLEKAEDETENDFVLSTVIVGEERALIPDLNRLEQALSNYF